MNQTNIDNCHEFFNIFTQVLPKEVQATAWEEVLASLDDCSIQR